MRTPPPIYATDQAVDEAMDIIDEAVRRPPVTPARGGRMGSPHSYYGMVTPYPRLRVPAAARSGSDCESDAFGQIRARRFAVTL